MSDLSAWIAEIRALEASDPPDLRAVEVSEHNMWTCPVAPMDPLDYERLPPADLHICGTCDGYGERILEHGPDPANVESIPCPDCAGTGQV